MTAILPTNSATNPAAAHTQPIHSIAVETHPASPQPHPAEQPLPIVPIQSPFRNWSDSFSFVVFWLGHLVSMIYFKITCIGKSAEEIAVTFRNTVITPQIATILTAPQDQAEAA